MPSPSTRTRRSTWRGSTRRRRSATSSDPGSVVTSSWSRALWSDRSWTKAEQPRSSTNQPSISRPARRGPRSSSWRHAQAAPNRPRHRYGFAPSRPLQRSPVGVHGYATPASRRRQEGRPQMREYQSGSADAAGNATFGPGLVFEGKLSFQGQVRFDGTFTGEITTDDLLIIGETAKVSADITCGSVVINGEVNGKIKARDSVELRGHARVKADLVTPSLVMDKGVVFDGYCNMMDKRDVVSLPTGESRKSWQGSRGNKHDRRNREALETQPADLSAQ